jgi:vesicle-associated membrane protein 7
MAAAGDTGVNAIGICYALLARGRTVLAEASPSGLGGNYAVVSRVLLGKITGHDEAASYAADENFVFHYLVSDGITYLCLSEGRTKRIPFAFLDDVKQQAVARFGVDYLTTAIAFAINAEFSPILTQRMSYFNSGRGDSLRGMAQSVESVKEGMVSSIEKVLERGERIELLVDKTESLSQQAFQFERSSKQLHRTMVLRRVKKYIYIALGVAIGLFIISSMACGGITFPHCK